MNEQEQRSECRARVIKDFEENMLEIKRAHEAGEITSQAAFDQALAEGNRAFEAMPEPKPIIPAGS